MTRGRYGEGPGRTASLYFPAVNAEFNWWLLIVGLVVGAGLVWYVVFDGRRREIDVAEAERAREATWLSAVLADEGHDVPPTVALRLLELHTRYLEAPPPDDPVAEDVGGSGDDESSEDDEVAIASFATPDGSFAFSSILRMAPQVRSGCFSSTWTSNAVATIPLRSRVEKWR